MANSDSELYPITEAARALGISYRRMRKQVEALGIQPQETKDDRRLSLVTQEQVSEIAKRLRHRKPNPGGLAHPQQNPLDDRQLDFSVISRLEEQIGQLQEQIEDLRAKIEDQRIK